MDVAKQAREAQRAANVHRLGPGMSVKDVLAATSRGWTPRGVAEASKVFNFDFEEFNRPSRGKWASSNPSASGSTDAKIEADASKQSSHRHLFVELLRLKPSVVPPPGYESRGLPPPGFDAAMVEGLFERLAALARCSCVERALEDFYNAVDPEHMVYKADCTPDPARRGICLCSWDIRYDGEQVSDGTISEADVRDWDDCDGPSAPALRGPLAMATNFTMGDPNQLRSCLNACATSTPVAESYCFTAWRYYMTFAPAAAPQVLATCLAAVAAGAVTCAGWCYAEFGAW